MIDLVATSCWPDFPSGQKALFSNARLKTNMLSPMGEQELAGVTLKYVGPPSEVLQLDSSHVACGFLQNNYRIDVQLFYSNDRQLIDTLSK